MPPSQSPPINLFVGGAPVSVDVQVLFDADGAEGPVSEVVDASSALTVSSGTAVEHICAIALHPTNPRAVVLTPGTSAGQVDLIVNTSPQAQVQEALILKVNVTSPPTRRRVVYVGHGPL